MKTDNPLDAYLATVQAEMPSALRSAVADVSEVLDLSWVIAQSVFEDKATPELAFAVFDRLVERLQVHWCLYSAPQEQT